MSFYFSHDGVSYFAHTVVGEGPARVVIEEVVQDGRSRESLSLDPSEDCE